MARVVYYTATSLNGFIATEENSLEWLFEVGEPEDVGFDRFFAGIGALAMGSTTYEWMLEHEDLIAHPEKWRGFYADRPGFVFTSRDLPRPEGADVTFLSGDVAAQVDRIRSAAGDRDVWVVGGGDLAAQFLAAGALDEIQVSVTPVTLSGGAPLFPADLRSDRMTLRSAEQHGQFAHLILEVGEPARADG